MELFTSLNNSIYERPKMVTCNFCIEEYDENQIINPILECNNHVYGECFSNYIEAELNVNHFPIKCPICPNDKRHDINFKTIVDCLILNDKDNLAKRLETISLNHLAETNPEIVTFCPTPGCNFLRFYDKDGFQFALYVKKIIV